MRTGASIDVNAACRALLEAILVDRNNTQRHMLRARIVLLTAGGAGTNEIMRTAGVSETAVWRWQQRFMKEGVDGLFRDKTRPSRIVPLGAAVRDRVVAVIPEDPPG